MSVGFVLQSTPIKIKIFDIRAAFCDDVQPNTSCRVQTRHVEMLQGEETCWPDCLRYHASAYRASTIGDIKMLDVAGHCRHELTNQLNVRYVTSKCVYDLNATDSSVDQRRYRRRLSQSHCLHSVSHLAPQTGDVDSGTPIPADESHVELVRHVQSVSRPICRIRKRRLYC